MNISLSSILLFAFVTPIIMTYRLSPGETPFWLFGIIFLGLLSTLITDAFLFKKKYYSELKSFLVWFVIIIVLLSTFISAIIVRHQTAPIYNIHDIILQQESAIRFLLDGINPYATTYFDTPLEDWHYSDTQVNPALYHFVMQPFYLIFSLPFYFVSNILFGFFDGRIPLLFLFLSLLGVAWRVPYEFEHRLQFVTLLALNPAMLSYVLEGRSDIFMYAFMFVGFYLLYLSRLSLSGVFLAFAFAVKQSAWMLFPFYAFYIYFRKKNIKQTLFLLTPFLFVFLINVAPFLLWDFRAFVDSTILYLSGSVNNSYPISGYGFGMLLHEAGFIKDISSYYPFIVWQVMISVPVLVILLRYFKKSPTVKIMILFYGIFLLIYWYFSRYFNNSHLGYLSTVFITAYFWPDEKSKEKEKE